MRPQAVSITDVQRARRHSGPFGSALGRWREIIESHQDLYLPFGVKCDPSDLRRDPLHLDRDSSDTHRLYLADDLGRALTAAKIQGRSTEPDRRFLLVDACVSDPAGDAQIIRFCQSQFICGRCQVSSDSWSWSENASVGRRSGPRWMAPSASRTSSLRAPEAV